MPKKVLFIGLIISCIIILFICMDIKESSKNTTEVNRNAINDYKNKATVTNTREDKYENDGIQLVLKNASNSVVAKTTQYSVQQKVFSYQTKKPKRNFMISFPQIINLNNKVVENRINKVIRKKALQYFNKKDIKDKTILGININGTYTIEYISEDKISILFYNFIDVYACHPSRDYFTINIDIKNGKVLNFSNAIKNSKEFMKSIKNKNKIIVIAEKKEYAVEVINGTYGGMKNLLKQLSDKEPSNDNYYITDKTMGFLEAISPSIGNYAIFEVEK